MQTYTYLSHTFTIEQDEDGTFTTVIDNQITNGGWAYRGSAFDYAQRRICEIVNAK